MLDSSNLKKAAFLDRDGVINFDYAYVHTPENFNFIPGVFEACLKLQELGYIIIIVTNQSGIGRGYYTEEDFNSLSKWMQTRFLEHGVKISDIFFCPHHPEKAKPPYRQYCNCRKPEPGMLLSAKQKWSIDMPNSLMVGDKPSDMLAAMKARVGTRILVGTDGKSMPEPVQDCTNTALNLLNAVKLILGN